MKARTPKAKRQPFATIEQTDIGTIINRAAPIHPDGAGIEEAVKANIERWESEEGRAYTRLRNILNAACVDPEVTKSEQLQRFTQLIRDIFYMAEPGEPPELFMEPVETLFAGMRSRAGGGGRPPVEEQWAQWRDRYQYLKGARSLTAQERYEDIAAEWAEAGNAPVKWQAVRDGISALNKREKNRV